MRLTNFVRILFFALLLSSKVGPVLAEVEDPFDPFDFRYPGALEEKDDDQKSAKELIDDARLLLLDKRPLDARSKLLKALAKDPQEYQAHLLLGHYYMEHVGHFRLALKYVLQAKALFEKQYGSPPYSDPRAQNDHIRQLYFLAQVRLNLDNYQGALDTLDEFSRLYYYAEWYHGTRAWVLMKLGRVQEAIKVARLGVLLGAEPGRVLNMLGILLSMSGERGASLKVFQDAITYELALGSEEGQPATPLNNSGEVYKEIFQEDKAESSWLKATRLPDGCEHILPSLNLALLYIDQLKLSPAKATMDGFDACVAQFPLRNGEEHLALEQLARGRIDLHAGFVDSAIARFEKALEYRQWFGKIGTSEDDLHAAALISLAQALTRKNNRESLRNYAWNLEWLKSLKDRGLRKWRAGWLMRRARQLLAEDLTDLEDLYIRNTDSLVEYPTFGEVLAGFPRRTLERKLALEEKADKRAEAQIYYLAYLAENYLEHGYYREAQGLLAQVLSRTRGGADDALRLHVLLLQLRTFEPPDPSYRRLAYEIFLLSRAALMNAGMQLPVSLVSANPSAELLDVLAGSAFVVQDAGDSRYKIHYQRKDNEHNLYFSDSDNKVGRISVRSASLSEAVNKLAEEVFSQDI